MTADYCFSTWVGSDVHCIGIWPTHTQTYANAHRHTHIYILIQIHIHAQAHNVSVFLLSRNNRSSRNNPSRHQAQTGTARGKMSKKKKRAHERGCGLSCTNPSFFSSIPPSPLPSVNLGSNRDNENSGETSRGSAKFI
jgi:hypothetical protein